MEKYLSLGGPEIEKKIYDLVGKGPENIELITDYYYELKRRALKRKEEGKNYKRDKKVLSFLETSGLQPIDWLDSARDVVAKVQKKTSGNHHIYCILVGGFVKGSVYGVYIGETRYKPENRFSQHKSGVRSARRARRFITLLPSLYRHINPLSRGEGKELEKTITGLLNDRGIRAFSG